VPVLVQDHLGILGVVDAALAEANDVVLVHEYELSIPSWLMRMSCDSCSQVAACAEAEALDVLLRLGDPVVRHHLLEAVVVALVQERFVDGERRLAGRAAIVRPVAPQVAAAVQVGERDARDTPAGAPRSRRPSVGEAICSAVSRRVRGEDPTRAGGRARSPAPAG
jgi:hypothetical protein